MIGPDLSSRLARAGIDPTDIGDPEPAWRRLHDVFGQRATLIDRYALEEHHRGVKVEEIPAEERRAMAERVIAAHVPGMELFGHPGGDPVEVVPYDAGWPERFQDWKLRIGAVVDPPATIHHVGSTSVAGLAAKPVIDVLVVVTDIDNESTYLPGLVSLGLPLRSREPDHRYFRPEKGKPRIVQVHVSGAAWAREHLLFRDYLRTHAKAADAYATLKRDLADTYRDDRLAYNEGKTGFILDTLEAAERWATVAGWESA